MAEPQRPNPTTPTERGISRDDVDRVIAEDKALIAQVRRTLGPPSTDTPLTWDQLAALGRRPNPPVGWQCPTCGKGNAPWSATCGHCRRKEKPYA